jgi:hypothetical protein
LREIVFEDNSTLQRIGKFALSGTALRTITIPSSVEIICESCFYECYLLREVIFAQPSSLKRIESFAFSRTEITKINIPSSVKIICDQCFLECYPLWEVTFASPSSLRIIEDKVFSHSTLKTIHIPSSVEIICEQCFERCCNMEEITFEKGSLLRVLDHFTFCCTLKLRAITIPSSVRVISSKCFFHCHALKQILFEEDSSLTRIDDNAFCACRSLDPIHLPASLSSLTGKSLNGLKGVSIHKDNPYFKVVGRDSPAVYDINGLTIIRLIRADVTSFIMPSNVQRIGEGCFSDLIALKEFIFQPNSSLLEIGKRAFSWSLQPGMGGLNQIPAIHIPASVELIADGCFAGCRELKTVTFEKDSRLKCIGHSAFACSGIRSIIIPWAVKFLGDKCFSECYDLVSLTFEENSLLKRVMGRDVFSNCFKLTIVIPENSRYRLQSRIPFQNVRKRTQEWADDVVL